MIYRRLARQIRPYCGQLSGIFVLSLLGTPLALLTPIPLKIAVDSVIGGQPAPSFLRAFVPATAFGSRSALLCCAAALLLIATVLIYLHSLGLWIWQTYIGERLLLDFRATLFRHVQRLSLTYHDLRGAADSTYRIQYDAPAVQQVVITGVIPLISAACTVLGMIYVTARLDWQLAVLALAICPVLFLLTRSFGHRLNEEWKDVKRLDSSANSIVQETLASMRVVKAFGREDHEHERFMRGSGMRMRGQLRVSFLQGWFDLCVGVTLAAGTAGTLLLGVLHVRSGLLTLGELLLIIAYIAQLYDPIKTLTKKFTDVQSGLASAERAFALLNEVPEVVELPESRALSRARGAIEFRDVDFSYDGRSPVLSGLSFSVPPGTRVGIAGRTGSGKTTLVSLLMRFYDVSAGAILLDGADVREFKIASLRNQFALMLQDPVLFSTTILENIRYARPQATYDEIVDAAKAANAHHFITNLPAGYETEVGERGMRLSGGERQRISLARAFLKDAPILILDEPTSSVDVTTEAAIMEGLERLMRDRTTFMIAHRLSTLDSCDMRLELEAGALIRSKAATHV